MKRVSAIVFILFLAGAAFAQQSAEIAAKVDAAVREFQAKSLAPAITVAVAVDGKVAYTKAFGTADVENDVKATPDTLIRTGSIAKPISAAAALTLVDAGKLDLDAPVQKYCPAFPQKQWTVTTRQTLGHLAGIHHYTGADFTSTKHFANMTDGFEMFATDPLLSEPGTKYAYSTYGYTLIGCVIEGASGEKFADYVSKHVLQPAGMTHTIVDDVFSIVPHRARGYQKREGKVENAGLMDSSYKVPGGGYVSTAEDLVRFQLAMLDGKIVKPATVELMWTSQKTTDGKPTNYGMGFGVMEVEGKKIVGHGGSQQGTSTSMAAIPSKHYAAAVMINMDSVNAQSLLTTINGLFGMPVPAPRR
jgi:serine beta-lactamase-like protein LACTB